MPYRADIESALCSAIEKEPPLDDAGIIFAHDGDAQILRHPATASDPYIYCSAGPDIRTAAPDPPLSTQWRTPWTPSNSRFDVPYDPSTAEKKGTPETSHDMINFGLDLVVLGLGIGVVVMTGGVGALGVWAGVQMLAGGVMAANDGARSVSDFADHGALGRFEDDSPRYKNAFAGVTDAALVVQFVDGEGLVDVGRGFNISNMTADMKRLLKVFAPVSDWRKANEALSLSKLNLGDALKGDIGPGQRVKLGKLLGVGGRKAKISTIRQILALKVANDFGASLITVGQASFGGPISNLYNDLNNFQFSLIFLNNKNSIQTSNYRLYNFENDDLTSEGEKQIYPRLGPHPHD